MKCPVCRKPARGPSFRGLATHLCARANVSDSDHVRWLNQSVARTKISAASLARSLESVYELPPDGLGAWIVGRFIRRFFGPTPHPFVQALQHPSRATLLGYVLEHRHFLRQWVRSCALILARTESEDAGRYEIDNLRTEFGGDGPDVPSHYELLLRMGESLGMGREEILATGPLPTTARTLAEWQSIAETEPWVSTMAAMHSLELIAHRDLVRRGASVHYFDPSILSSAEVTPEARAFLREGYEADVGHAEEALRLVERYAGERDLVPDVQAVFLRSIDLFDDYLGARLQRAEMIDASA